MVSSPARVTPLPRMGSPATYSARLGTVPPAAPCLAHAPNQAAARPSIRSGDHAAGAGDSFTPQPRRRTRSERSVNRGERPPAAKPDAGSTTFLCAAMPPAQGLGWRPGNGSPGMPAVSRCRLWFRWWVAGVGIGRPVAGMAVPQPSLGCVRIRLVGYGEGAGHPAGRESDVPRILPHVGKRGCRPGPVSGARVRTFLPTWNLDRLGGASLWSVHPGFVVIAFAGTVSLVGLIRGAVRAGARVLSPGRVLSVFFGSCPRRWGIAGGKRCRTAVVTWGRRWPRAKSWGHQRAEGRADPEVSASRR